MHHTCAHACPCGHTHTHTHTHTAQAFNKLEAHVRAIMQFRFGIGMVDTLVAKYMATVVKRKKKRKENKVKQGKIRQNKSVQ